MKWNLLLYSCFHTQGREYDFDVVAPSDGRLGAAVRSLGIGPGSFVAGRFEGRVFFGRRDLVGKALGWDHPVARDSSRTLEYLILYIAPGDVPLPAWRELAAVERRIAADLADYGSARMRAGVPLEHQVEIGLPVFAGPESRPAGEGGWDAALDALSAGGDQVVIAADAGQCELRALVPERAGRRTDRAAAPDLDAEMQALIDQKTSASARVRPILWFAAAGAAFAATVASCHLFAAQERPSQPGARDDPGETTG